MITDEKGAILGCDHLTALLCQRFLAQAPGAAVVYDLRSSKVVPQRIEALGGRPVRSRVGHVFMKELLRKHGGIFAGELSGHFYFRDNAYADSGAIALAALLSMLGRDDVPLSALVDPLRKYPQSGEINYRVADKQAVLDQLKSKYAAVATIDELDGVTIDAFDAQGWWFNVRPSNTEPLLRLNAEAADPRKLADVLTELQPLLGEPAAGH
jgi:phosphomannomutase